MIARTERLQQLKEVSDYQEYDRLNPVEKGLSVLLKWIDANELQERLTIEQIDSLCTFVEMTTSFYLQARGGYPGSSLPFTEQHPRYPEMSLNVLEDVQRLSIVRSQLKNVQSEIVDIAQIIATRCAFDAIRREMPRI